MTFPSITRPTVTMEESWAAQAQFGPFGEDVIRELAEEWERYWASLDSG